MARRWSLAGHGDSGADGDGDVTGRVLDLLDLQRVDHDPELLHLPVATVFDFLGEPVSLPDDFLNGEASDDGAEVAGEDAAYELLHAVLLGQKASRRVRDRDGVVAYLERRDEAGMWEPDALRGDAVLGAISDSCSDKERSRAFCLIGNTKQPCPVTIRNCVSWARRLDPEIKSASLGAGTCQNNMELPPELALNHARAVTETVLPERISTTTTRVYFAIDSSAHAVKASVPPRTGSTTSPGRHVGRIGIGHLAHGAYEVLVQFLHCSPSLRSPASSTDR